MVWQGLDDIARQAVFESFAANCHSLTLPMRALGAIEVALVMVGSLTVAPSLLGRQFRERLLAIDVADFEVLALLQTRCVYPYFVDARTRCDV